MSSSGTTATSGQGDDHADRQPDDQRAEAHDGADRHRPELEALVAAVPPDPARPARVLLGEPAGEERAPAAAPGAAPAHAPPQHRRQRRAGRARAGWAATAARSHATAPDPRDSPRCVVAWPACSSSSPPSCLALAAGGWWLQRVAFDTARSGDLAHVVLRDDAIRNADRDRRRAGHGGDARRPGRAGPGPGRRARPHDRRRRR